MAWLLVKTDDEAVTYFNLDHASAFVLLEGTSFKIDGREHTLEHVIEVKLVTEEEIAAVLGTIALTSRSNQRHDSA